MFRFAIALALLSASHGVLAAPPAADAQPSGAGPSAAPAAKSGLLAEPDRLMPPLPPLASLPPSAAQAAQETDDDASATRGGRRTKKASRARTRAGKPAETSIRMVVSPESRAYLASVSSKLDAALQGIPQDARPASDAGAVAMTH